MPDNQEEVVYAFTGDVSSLRQATEQALGLLDKYQNQIDRITADGGFGKSTRAANTFQNAVTKTTKTVEALQKKMKGVSDVKLMPSYDATRQISTSIESMYAVFNKLRTSSQLTTKEIQAMTVQLRAAQQGMKSSSADVENLVAKELKFQQTLEAVRGKIGRLREGMDSIRNKVTSTFDPLISKLNSLRNPFSRLVHTVQSFRDKAVESFGRVTQLASTVVAALRRVSTAEGDVAASTSKSASAHTRFRSILTGLHSALKKETAELDTERKSLKSKTSALDKTNKAHSSLGSVIARLGRNIHNENLAIKSFNLSLKNLSNISGLARAGLLGLTSVPISYWLSEAANQSIKFTENLNLFTVAMGDSLDEGLAFVEQMQELYGMDPSNLMRYAGNFYQLSDAIDMPAEAAANLSLGLTKATNDIASLFNVDVETVFENLSSGMQGMSRAVRKYGMDIRTTTLQTTALSLGITQNVEDMSEANRMGLRFITMMKQASNASGDFARNIESPANQLRIFKEQMSQLGRAIGNIFIGPLRTALQYINGFIMALRVAIEFVTSLFGIFGAAVGADISSSTDAADNLAGSVAGVGDAAGGAAKKIKKMLAPFDELIVLQSQSNAGGSGGGAGGLGDVGALDPAIAEAIANMQWELEQVRMKAVEVRDAILEFFGFEVEDGKILSWSADVFEQNLIDKFPQWTKTIQATFDNWTAIVDGFKNVFKALGEIAAAIWENIINILQRFINDTTVADFISNLADRLNNFADFLSRNKDLIADFATAVLILVGAFQGFKVVSKYVAPVVQVLTNLAGAIGGAGLGSVVTIVAGVVAALVLLYTNSDAFAQSINNLFGSLLSGFQSILTALWDALVQIGESLARTWSEHIQPFLSTLGEAFAPVIDTLVSLWENLVSIITVTFEAIGNLWTSVVEPVLGAFFDGLGALAEIFKELWESVVGPVVENIGDSIESMWKNQVLPILERAIEVIGAIIEIILALWNNILAPVLRWLVSSFGPLVGTVFNTIWDVVSAVFSGIGEIIEGLLGALGGLVEFLAGVFTGNWSRAWRGLVNVAISVANMIIGVFESMVNGIIGVINGMIGSVFNGVKGLVNSITSAISGVADTLGYNINLRINASPPKISKLSIPRIPMMYGGGTVNAGQLFMARENGMPELVGSFGGTTGVMNNQQIVEAVASGVYNAVVSAMSTSSGDQETVVEVDGEKLFKIMVGRNRRAIVRTGVNPMGGAT